MDPNPIIVNEPTPRPWGFWLTGAFSFLISVAFLACQILVGIVFLVVAIVRDPDINFFRFAETLTTNGLYMSVATFLSTPVCIGLTIMFAMARGGITIREYFSLKKIGWRQLLKWQLALIAFVIVTSTLTAFSGSTVASEFMMAVYSTAVYTPLLWLAVIIAAPFFEEMFFRGFLFVGIQNSPLGSTGAILLTSIFWSAIHIQYDYVGIATIFAAGLLFGFARIKSDSIYPCIAMHSLMNLISTVEIMIYSRMS